MPSYTTPATSTNPALIVYLLDISGSMAEPAGQSTKIDVVMTAMRKQAIRMVQRSTKGGIVAARYRIAMYAYSSFPVDLLGGVKTITELAQLGMPQLVPQEITDTAAAFEEAEKLLLNELPNLQDCPAPLVCHMTDGEWNGPRGDPVPIAQRIMQMSVPDGNVLVENIFVTDDALSTPLSDPKEWGGITDPSQLATDYARTLYEMSSPLPDSYRKIIREMGYDLQPNARMMLPGNTPEVVELGFAISGSTPTTS